jgi:hypothetical protein
MGQPGSYEQVLGGHLSWASLSFSSYKALQADYLFLLIPTLQHQFVNSIQKSLIVENNI